MSEQNPSEALPPQSPQQSFGSAQPPPPQQSFGQAPPAGQVPPGGQAGFGSAPPPQPAQPAEPVPKKRGGRLVGIVVLLVLVAGIGGAAWWFTRDSATNAQVGDCLAGTTPEELNADKLKVVPCTQTDAGFKVVERIENKTETEANSACTESTEDRWVFWSGKKDSSGTVLCLGRNAP